MSIRLVDQQAREKAGMPAEWQPYEYAWHPPGQKPLYMEVRGAVAPPYKSGPHKGTPNWRRRDRATDRTVYLTTQELDAYRAEWERTTGKCSRCEGSGQTPAGWSREAGQTYRACPQCKGAGRAGK